MDPKAQSLFQAALGAPAAHQVFAAPAQFTAVNPAFSVVRTLLALLLVVAVVYAAAALLRRLRLVGGQRSPNLEIISQVSLGARERAVLMRAGTQQLLVGVAPGHVQLLCMLPEGTSGDDGRGVAAGLAEAARPAAPSFRDLLRRSLGR